LFDSRVSVCGELSTGFQRYCGTTQRDDYGGTAGKLHRLRYTAAWFHSDCNVELHGCTTPGDMHGFAIVGDTGWEERGACDGYVEYHGARFLAALGLAAICAANAWMGDVGSVVRVACDIGIIDNLQLEPWFSPAAWPCGDSHSSRCFALHVLLWRLWPAAAGQLNAVVGSAQPNQCQWWVFLDRHGYS
jgi:hypothetical protein